jgi:transcriptional regulator with XRE-family HTH domain
VSELGEIIRRQRELSRLSMRQFAQLAGISNPYLSQIERGLREPSERVVESIARSLETTAAALYEEAGLVAEEEGALGAVPDAIAADPALSPRQRKVMLEVYDAFAGELPDRQRRHRSRAAPGAAED